MREAAGDVRIKALGSLEVLVGDRPVPAGGAKQRLLLAALLANVNEVVSADRLIDVLWGDSPPEQARRTLQKYVYHLREIIEPRRGDADGEESVLLTRPPGYELRLASDHFDIASFEALVADGQRLARGADLTSALARFDDAIRLWRGPAWAEFADDELFQVEAARLDSLRSLAIEDRADVALALGRHAEVISDLEAAIAAHPLRERPRAQLMLALYRNGQHAEALRAYHAFRSELAEDVGLEPSSSLQELQDAIVAQKPELDWTAPTTIGRTDSTVGPQRVPGGDGSMPSGTVTFVFTDIEGSTRLFRRLKDDYAAVLERHRALIRYAIEQHGGVEVNVEGDGMFFAFADAAEATAACIAGQRALIAEPWPDGATVRVRMGLHTGRAEPAHGDYIAIAVHQAARVTSVAHGSQIVMSQATRQALDAAVHGGAIVQSLGAVALKDFDQPVDLFQVCDAELPAVFPPLRLSTSDRHAPVAVLPGPLDADRSPLVGRRADLDWLDVLWQRAIGGDRVVAALVGPRGSGKSRLIAEFARRVHVRDATVIHHVGTDGWVNAFQRASTTGNGAGSDAPVLIVLDDWTPSDAELADVRREVESVRTAAGVLVVATRGEDPRQPTALTVRHLAPLASDDVAEMLARAIGPQSAELVEAVFAETDGSPRLVADVAHRLRERDAAERVERALSRASAASRDLHDEEERLVTGMLERARHDESRPPTHDGNVVAVCPYKGLARFDIDDAAYFFGREHLVAALVARLAIARFVGVIGASGSGKSSVVRAGLLAALSHGALPGSDGWPTIVLTPGAEPIENLASALSPLTDMGSHVLREVIERDVDEFVRVLSDAARKRGVSRIVVAVDQFEEVATLCRDAEKRERFLSALVDAATDPEGPMAVIAVMRADYYGALASHPELARLFEQSQTIVGAMNRTELRRAIVEPAKRAGLVAEEALVDTVCQDANDEPGALPLVSTALLETWVRRRDNTLTADAYEQAGGVHGALGRMADDVYNRFDDEQQMAARRILLRLAEPGEGKDDVRRRAARGEMPPGEVAASVLSTLVDRRLVVTDEDAIEVAHEALLREWPRLRGWLEADRDGRRLHRHLTEDSIEWDRTGRDASSLYRGARLGAATDWAALHGDDFNSLERDFLDAAMAHHDQELREAQHTARRLRSLAIGLAMVLVVALAAASVALVKQRDASHQSRIAHDAAGRAETSNAVALAHTLGTDNTDLSLLLGIETHRQVSSIETEGGLEGALAHVPPGVDQVLRVGSVSAHPAVSADGRILAAPGLDGSVQLWDIATARVLRTTAPASSAAITASFSRDGRLLLLEHQDGDVDIVDVDSGAPAGAGWRLGPARAYAVFAAADGSRVLTINQTDTHSNDWQILDWDRTDTEHPHTSGSPLSLDAGPGSAPTVTVSPDFRFISAGNTLYSPTPIYDLSSGQLAASVPGNAGTFAPDGQSLAVADGDHLALRHFDNGEAAGAPFPPFAASPTDIVFNADGTKIAATDFLHDGRVAVFDVVSRKRVGLLTMQTGSAPTAFLPDGRLVVSSGGEVVIWRPGVTVPPIGTPLGPPAGPAGGQFSPDGRVAVTFGVDVSNNAQPPLVWDSRTGASIGQLPSPDVARFAQGGGYCLWFNPDGTKVAMVYADGLVRIWDRTSGDLLSVLDGHRGGEQGVTWSPRGDRIATVGAGQNVLLWDLTDIHHPVRTGSPIVLPGEPGPSLNPPWIYPPFTADGRSLILDDLHNGRIVLLDAYTQQEKWSLERHSFSGIAYPKTGNVAAVTTNTAGDIDVSMVDMATGTVQHEFVVHGATFLDFIRNDTELVATGTVPAPDGSGQLEVVRFIDVATAQQIGEPLIVSATPTTPSEALLYLNSAAAEVADVTGTRFQTSPSSPGQGVVLWTADPAEWEGTACRIAGRNFTRSEWAQYLPSQPYRVTCPQWPSG
jgi:DNA-binding SARP family transcriptional activator/class 3 adenylate cyclase/WD40 repeat protein/energy-coupling factor transporter ATP-binding protein EcfA2